MIVSLQPRSLLSCSPVRWRRDQDDVAYALKALVFMILAKSFITAFHSLPEEVNVLPDSSSTLPFGRTDS